VIDLKMKKKTCEMAVSVRRETRDYTTSQVQFTRATRPWSPKTSWKRWFDLPRRL